MVVIEEMVRRLDKQQKSSGIEKIPHPHQTALVLGDKLQLQQQHTHGATLLHIYKEMNIVEQSAKLNGYLHDQRVFFVVEGNVVWLSRQYVIGIERVGVHVRQGMEVWMWENLDTERKRERERNGIRRERVKRRKRGKGERDEKKETETKRRERREKERREQERARERERERG